ncbi:hypothetical protein NEMBOFW57_008139 [Staphylotrichum longicolle]|uniref:Uncharacterized protein n=1 Tax=Staphylotrichum longicolle TaxID=669026 RepID=A0AAD4ERD8_9PEZI|nr:hypothetical protein NEMBOFW57_008139 [Staphylotrichum longicolle]
MEHLNTYTVPACAPPGAPPDSFITQLNLFAGQLYLRNYAEYVRMCRYPGLSYTKNSGEEKNKEVKEEKEEEVKGEKEEEVKGEKDYPCAHAYSGKPMAYFVTRGRLQAAAV